MKRRINFSPPRREQRPQTACSRTSPSFGWLFELVVFCGIGTICSEDSAVSRDLSCFNCDMLIWSIVMEGMIVVTIKHYVCLRTWHRTYLDSFGSLVSSRR